MNSSKRLALVAATIALFLSRAGAQVLPGPVQAYLDGAPARLAAEPEIQEGKKADFYFNYHQLFAKPAIDYRNGGKAWLVGLGIGELKGKSMTELGRIVLLSESGEEIFKHPDAFRGERVLDGCFTGAIVVEMAPSLYVIAMSSPAGRGTPGSVSVRTLDKDKPRELFTCGDTNFPGEPGIESTLYFHDINGDGRKELLVEQQLLHYSQGRKEIKRRVFRLESTNQSFVEVTSQYESQLAGLFAAAKGTLATPRTSQQSRPYESTVFGKVTQ
ncbi:hypothetical protein [Roseimicrobium sp. ORNL1]|uniref:hypothetical protein n=1 Tax=Roseimicrobium sp. ORNL1 TaxID=2711231 RepID=UPI0013E205EB|nr:hypothetical protein [Roseimicrobium sp. ORNL1]QIF05568.1 hypothetical protein G5S37_30080 [Roseimicrobium sp. ORNL1]